MDNKKPAGPDGVKAVDTLQKVLVDIGWKPRRDEETTGFVVEFDPPYIPISTAFAVISAERQHFILFVNFGLAAEPDQRDEVCRFIARANWGLLIGNFEMDYGDGHVRFRSGVNFAGTELSETLIENAILPAINAIEIYGDSLIEVVVGKKNAEDAIKEAEAKTK
jgi:hypothetical protein